MTNEYGNWIEPPRPVFDMLIRAVSVSQSRRLFPDLNRKRQIGHRERLLPEILRFSCGRSLFLVEGEAHERIFEEILKNPGDGLREFPDTDCASCLALEAGHFHALNAAGRDFAKGFERIADIDGKAVHGHPLPQADSQGGHFAVSNPDAGQSLAALRCESVFSAGPQEDFLEEAQTAVDIPAAASEMQDGISDELPRTVKGGLPSPVGFHDGMGQVGGIPQARVVPGASDGIDRLMLEQEEGFPTSECLGHEGLLQGKGLIIGDDAQATNLRHVVFGVG